MTEIRFSGGNRILRAHCPYCSYSFSVSLVGERDDSDQPRIAVEQHIEESHKSPAV